MGQRLLCWLDDLRDCHHRTFLVILILFGSAWMSPVTLYASSKLTVQSDNTIIYTGPNIRYRPLKIVGRGTVLPLSPKIVSTEGGEFYKVLIRGKGKSKKQRRVGYIPETAAVLIEHSEEPEEDIEEYIDLALAESSFQASFSYLRAQSYVWQAGYLKYPAPGFYFKGFFGQVFDETSGSFLTGIESGNDSFIAGRFSAYASVGLGVLLSSNESSPFTGADGATSFYLSGSAGTRYNASEDASVSIGLGNVSIFNKNNSFVSLAVVMTFEVGL